MTRQTGQTGRAPAQPPAWVKRVRLARQQEQPIEQDCQAQAAAGLATIAGFAWLGGALVVPYVGAADAAWWFALAAAGTWLGGGCAAWWLRRRDASRAKLVRGW